MQTLLDAMGRGSSLAVRFGLAVALTFAASVPIVHGTAFAQQKAQPRYSVDTSISTLANDKRSKAIVDKYMPGMTSGPHYLMAATFTPRQIKSRMSGMITEAKFNQMQKELTKLR